MIPMELLQKSIITTLRQNAPLNSALLVSGTVILENQFQGTEFSYPAIRVDIQPQVPIGTGTDRIRLSNSVFVVRTYSVKKSSYEANHLLTLVNQALFDTQIKGNSLDTPNFMLLRVNLINVDGAFRVGNRLWMAVATYESEGNIIINP